MAKSALHDHAVAVSQARVTGRTKDVETLLSALKDVLSYGKGQEIAGAVADFAGIEIGIGAPLAASHGSFNRRALGTHVGEERALRERLVSWLIVHVLTASSQHQQETQPRNLTQLRHRAS